MHFCNLRKMHPEPSLKLNDIPLPMVDQFKFLGVIFDKKLSFIPHIKYLKTKCQKALNLLKVVSHMDWGADRDVLLRLYRALIRSKLDYGSIVYGSARMSYIKMLDTIHNQGLRLCLGAFRTSPMESLYAEANEPSLYRRRMKLSLQYAVKLKAFPNNPVHYLVYHPKLTTQFTNKPNAIPTFGIRIQKLYSEMNINLHHISESELSIVPPWELSIPNIDYSLRIGKKGDCNPLDFQSKFCDIRFLYPDFCFIFTDGSKDGNKVGSAAVTKGSSYKQRLPDGCSVFTAELKAISLALKHIEGSNHQGFVICSDSLSALQALENRNIGNPLVLDILTEYHNIKLKYIIVIFCWVPSHVDIPGNELADKAAKAALDLRVTISRVPYTDFRPLIQVFIQTGWQQFWDEQVENKLHFVKTQLGPWNPIYDMRRRDQLVMARARIGHTYLTQGYLLRGEEAPVCVSCRERLTVEHVLLFCTDLSDIRQRYHECHSVNQLFKTVNIYSILNFLKETGVYRYF